MPDTPNESQAGRGAEAVLTSGGRGGAGRPAEICKCEEPIPVIAGWDGHWSSALYCWRCYGVIKKGAEE